MYSKNYNVRYSETGENFNLTLPALMSYFQDTSVEHSEFSNNGAKKLAKNHLAWILTGWHVRIFRYPTLFENVSAATWATDFKHVYGYRNFSLTDKDQNIIAQAASVWVLYNYEKLKFQKITKQDALDFGTDKISVFDDDTSYRLQMQPEYKKICSLQVQKGDIDSNGHVNNISYISYIVNAFADLSIFDLRIQYKSQARLNDKINISAAYDNDTIHVIMTSDNDDVYILAQIKTNFDK